MDELPYRQLAVWQKAHRLAMDVLDTAERPAIARRFYFKNQVCSCAMSIAANIAEGHGRGTNLDFASFVDRARGSLFELDTWLYTADLKGYLAEGEYAGYASRLREVNAMLFTLRESLRRNPARRGT